MDLSGPVWSQQTGPNYIFKSILEYSILLYNIVQHCHESRVCCRSKLKGFKIKGVRSMGKPCRNSECEGVHGSRPRTKCTLSRANKGSPIQMSKACAKCNEWRCRAHCKCNRSGKAQGRAASRGVAGRPASSSVCEHTARASAPRTDSVQVLDGIRAVLDELSTARNVIIATYVYDDVKLHQELLRRLASGSFSAELRVAASQVSTTNSRYMKASLKQLLRAGAVVRLCRVHKNGRFFGSFHHKVMVIDERLAFVGSANFTCASRSNGETVLCVSGPCVLDILSNIKKGRSDSELLSS